jgi:hypothetical protein
MTAEEQAVFLAKEYAEAARYMDNARGFLLKAKKDGSVYTDKKYVRTACGTAYNGVLIALDAWLAVKGVPKPSKKQRKSIDWYMDSIAKLDGKVKSLLYSAYEVLHLAGYYDGIKSVKIIASGFDVADEIIGKIKTETGE